MSTTTPFTKEMEDYFLKRTKQHIERVAANLFKMVQYKSVSLQQAQERAALHDLSKYEQHERAGYIFLTWWHYCKKNQIPFEYPSGVEQLVEQSVQHHITNNVHHPETHADCNSMSELDIVEMVCDWTAISQEYGSPSCKAFVDKNLHRWAFNDAVKIFIYETIAEMDKRNHVM